MTKREKLFAFAGGALGVIVGFVPLELGRLAEKAPDPPAVAADPPTDPGPPRDAEPGIDPAMAANANLTESLAQCSRELGRVGEEKARVEQQLEVEHAAEADAGRSALSRRIARRSLSQDDWKQLARTGTIKYALPCASFDPPSGAVNLLGLNPREVPGIRDDFTAARDAAWAQVRPLCAAAVGGVPQADKLGLESCPQIILASARATDPTNADAAMRAVANVRAGLADPTTVPAGDPVASMFSALTLVSKDAEGRIAARLGPEDARVVVYGNSGCTHVVEFAPSAAP